MYFLFKTIRAFALPCKKKKAILSIEAALVLPLFLISMMTLMTLLSVYYINGKIEASINEEAKYIALNYCDGGYSTSAVQVDIESKLGANILNSSIIKNNQKGLDFSKTDLSDGEVLIICVNYVIRPPFSLFSAFDIPIEKRVVIHSWIGYIHGLNGLDSDYVYMTKNGTVYHRSRECSHIRLSIKATDGKSIKKLRNENGGKYKKCEYCRPKLSSEKLYITSDGDRYHSTLMCSGLKRTIIRVKLSNIGDISPCLRCGY